MYLETRSKRAVSIDRAKVARTRYSSFNDAYAAAPNRSDVVGYDVGVKAGTGKAPAPKPKPKPKPAEKPKGDYYPTPSEKAKLLKRFHSLPIYEQHKDLLTTRNVARSKADIAAWKKNPKQHDIRGIDTQPKELIDERLAFTTKYVGNPKLQLKRFNWKYKGGSFAGGEPSPYRRGAYIPNPEHSGIIRVDTSKKNWKKSYGHELGHAFDRNIIETGKQKREGTITGTYAIKVGNPIAETVIGGLPSNIDFGKTNNLVLKTKMQVRNVDKKISPYKDSDGYSFVKYRRQEHEEFANWFAGLVTGRKGLVKNKSKTFYSYFKKRNKPFIRGLKNVDIGITSKYIKSGRKSKSTIEKALGVM